MENQEIAKHTLTVIQNAARILAMRSILKFENEFEGCDESFREALVNQLEEIMGEDYDEVNEVMEKIYKLQEEVRNQAPELHDLISCSLAALREKETPKELCKCEGHK